MVQMRAGLGANVIILVCVLALSVLSACAPATPGAADTPQAPATSAPTNAAATNAAPTNPPPITIPSGGRLTPTAVPTTTPTDTKNAAYVIEGRTIKLNDGESVLEAAPGSASKITTMYFGNEATGDLNGDGQPDVALLLTQNQGGSGTFFYVVVALKTKDGYTGTNGVLLGDRISPQTTEYRGGQVIVNYADRKPGEPMITAPSVGVSKTLKVMNGQLVEVK